MHHTHEWKERETGKRERVKRRGERKRERERERERDSHSVRGRLSRRH